MSGRENSATLRGEGNVLERRYRTVTVVLDEAVGFEEAMAVVRAIRQIRGVDEAHLNQVPGGSERSSPPSVRTDPASLEP